MKGLTHKRSILGILCALFFGMILLIPTDVEAAELTVTSSGRKDYTAVANGETIRVTLSGAATNTYVMGKPSWITVTGSTASYKLVVAKNTAKSSRSGDVTFRAGNKVFTVRITQKGAPTSVTVKFDNNGGTGKVQSKSYKIGSAYSKLPAGPAAPKGMKFDGWYTKKSGGTKVTTKTKASASVTVLYAHYKNKSYKVTFDSRRGTKVGSMKVTYNHKYGIMEEPERYGYDFVGWFTAEKGGKKVDCNTTVTTAANHTLYAHWKEKEVHTVEVYYDKKNNVSKTYKVYHGEKFTLPKDPPFGGQLNFEGWRVTIVGGIGGVYKNPGATITVTEDLAVYPEYYKEMKEDRLTLGD